MMQLSAAADIVGGELRGADATFTGVSTDSRTLARGDLFVALKGERYDGHAYVPALRDAGAAGAIVARGIGEASCSQLVVDDPERALATLARAWRSRSRATVTALTGSSGKTTVKEMLAAILRTHAGEGAVLATQGNLNNHIGVPLTLLRLRAEHRYAVIELGMNHAGEIRALAGLAAPDVALVTNAGTAHLEFLGTREAIARAKGEIFEALPADGTAVINADDVFAPLWRDLSGAHARIEFGLQEAAQVGATFRSAGLDSEIRLTTPLGSATAQLRAPGLHNVRNALAASAAATALRLAPEIIAQGLGTFSGVQGRLQRKHGVHGATVLDDTYNANPDSVRAAIDVLAAADAPTLLVLGDMGELGADSTALHAELGRYARARGVTRLLALGEASRHAVTAFGADGLHAASLEALLAAVDAAAVEGATVLVKGSRFMRMERVVAALTGEETATVH